MPILLNTYLYVWSLKRDLNDNKPIYLTISSYCYNQSFYHHKIKYGLVCAGLYTSSIIFLNIQNWQIAF